MRILHAIANLAPRYGGPSKACFEMARAVARLGHDVSILTTNQDGPDVLDVPTDRAVVRDGVAIRYFPVQRPRFWGTSLPLARALREGVRTADVAHIHSLYLFHGMVAGHHCRKFGVPYLIRPHGTLDPYLHRRHRRRKQVMELLFEERNLRHAAAVHFTSDEERRLAAPYVYGAPGVVVPLGVEPSDYESLPERGSFKASRPDVAGKRVVLFFGRLNFKKGLDVLVDAFALLAAARDDVHLVLAGPDNDGYAAEVAGWLDQRGLRSRATFTGMVTGEHKLAVLRDADVFALPSYTENFGLAVVEAMACGLPVVVSNRVNLWREIEDAGAGLVGPCDASRFAGLMGAVLDHPERARDMGECGRALVRQRFSWSKLATRLVEVYDRVRRRGQALSEPSTARTTELTKLASYPLEDRR